MTNVLFLYKIDDIYVEQLIKAGIGAEVLPVDEKGDVSKNPNAMKDLQGKDVLAVRSQKITGELMDNSNLATIIRAGAGVNTIDIDSATEREIVVQNTPGMNSQSVVELVFNYLHAFNYPLASADSRMREGFFAKGKLPHTELSGKTIGIVGLGNIGKRVNSTARGYGMETLSYDPFVSDSIMRDLGAMPSSLENIFSESDVVTLHASLTDETKGFIDYRLLSMMKDYAIFINAARAQIVNFEDLLKVMEEKPNLRCASDVFKQEDVGDDVKKIAAFGKRVILTPHEGGNSTESKRRVSEEVIKTIISFHKRQIIHPVNYTIPAGLDHGYLELANRLGNILGNIARQHGKVDRVEMTCYCGLKPFAEILLDYGLAGIKNCYSEGTVTPVGIKKRFSSDGVSYKLREQRYDEHGDSITFDVFTNGFTMSIRGALDEDKKPIIRRIHRCDNLRIRPEGNLALFVYEKAPGALASLAAEAYNAGLNILGTSQEDAKEDESAVCVFTLNTPYPPETMDHLVKDGLRTPKGDKTLKVYTATTMSL